MINYVDNSFRINNTLSFDKDSPPIKVKSAFGGFGIYKMNYVLKNKRYYQGTQIVDLTFKDNTQAKLKFQKCEHVNFNFGFLDQNLELYILPSLINREYLEVTFPPQAALNLIIKRTPNVQQEHLTHPHTQALRRSRKCGDERRTGVTRDQCRTLWSHALLGCVRS